MQRSSEIKLFRDAVYALNCLRLFDCFSHIAVEMRAACASFRGTKDLLPSGMRTVADLLSAVKANFRPGPAGLILHSLEATIPTDEPVVSSDPAAAVEGSVPRLDGGKRLPPHRRQRRPRAATEARLQAREGDGRR